MLATIVDDWLGKFENALRQGDGAALRDLFHADCHWRDLLAFTWDIRTVSGADAVVASLQQDCRARAGAFGFAIARTARRRAG